MRSRRKAPPEKRQEVRGMSTEKMKAMAERRGRGRGRDMEGRGTSDMVGEV